MSCSPSNSRCQTLNYLSFDYISRSEQEGEKEGEKEEVDIVRKGRIIRKHLRVVQEDSPLWAVSLPRVGDDEREVSNTRPHPWSLFLKKDSPTLILLLSELNGIEVEQKKKTESSLGTTSLVYGEGRILNGTLIFGTRLYNILFNVRSKFFRCARQLMQEIDCHFILRRIKC